VEAVQQPPLCCSGQVRLSWHDVRITQRYSNFAFGPQALFEDQGCNRSVLTTHTGKQPQKKSADIFKPMTSTFEGGRSEFRFLSALVGVVVVVVVVVIIIIIIIIIIIM
jgi:hypothetical protein